MSNLDLVDALRRIYAVSRPPYTDRTATTKLDTICEIAFSALEQNRTEEAGRAGAEKCRELIEAGRR